jgi:cell division protein FtsB
MSNTISSLAAVVRSVVSLALLAILALGGWFGYRIYDERKQVDRDLAEKTAALVAKTAEAERLTLQNEKLDLALRLLKVDHRVAEIDVLEQRQGDERQLTKFQFVELDKNGDRVGEKKVFTVEGNTIYVDAWVIKFSDALVEGADPLRSTSVCLFRRIFGEYQEPSEGFALDAAGSRPSVYSQGNSMSPLEHDIWSNFWDYANSPAKSKAAGLRAAHGEAPSIRLEMGKRYRVELRASAGLSIVAEDAPPESAL